MRGSRGESWGPYNPRPGKSHVAIGFLINTGTDPRQETIPSQRRSIPPAVKYADDSLFCNTCVKVSGLFLNSGFLG